MTWGRSNAVGEARKVALGRRLTKHAPTVISTLLALSLAAAPVDFKPVSEVDRGREVRAVVGVVGMGLGYVTALVQDVVLVANFVSTCAQQSPLGVGCIAAPATGLGLVSLSLVPVAGPIVLGWLLDTGVEPYKVEQPTWGYRVAGFTAAAVQVVGILFLLSAVEGPLGNLSIVPTFDAPGAAVILRW